MRESKGGSALAALGPAPLAAQRERLGSALHGLAIELAEARRELTRMRRENARLRDRLEILEREPVC